MMDDTAFQRGAGDHRRFRPEPDRPLALLSACPAHKPTPLRHLPALAGSIGVGRLAAKDETGRMNLGSFKALGGAFAVAQMICETAGTDDPTGDAARAAAGAMTFITASAGNHGLSVAAGARVFGARAVVVLAAGVPESFAGRLRALEAEVMRVDGTYEDSVARAAEAADANGWLHLADGSWPGYVDRPALVMEGYTVMSEECRAEFAERGEWPSHIYLQAGVGGLAAAMAAHIRCHWPVQPQIIVVEPAAAPCLAQSVEAGSPSRADGPVSNMGRLDCKEASLIAFEALRRDADGFIQITDAEAATAANRLAAHGIATTPSGAAGLAGIVKAGPGERAHCLIIVSEGSDAD